MNKVALALVLALYPGTAYAAAPNFTPASLVDITSDAVCTFASATRTISFQYRFRSLESSQQGLVTLLVAYGNPISGSSAPPGWISDDMTNGYWSFSIGFDAAPLAPGGELLGAELVSIGLPAVEEFRAKGNAPDPPAPPSDLTDEEYKAYVSAADYFNNSAKGYTVAPGSVTTNAPVAAVLSFLTAQKEKAAGLGWIDNQGIVNSLDVKLSAAQRALGRGDNRAASGELGAFEHEVAAQNGKHLNGNAFAILQTGAEVAMSDLQSRSGH